MRIDEASPTQRAIDWHLRLREATPVEWEAFTDWLEAAPANAAAYDRVVALDAAMPRPSIVAAPMALPLAANDDEPSPARWRWLGGVAAVAACLALTLPFVGQMFGGAKPYTLTTAPGETRQVALADGTRVELSGGTRLRLDHANPRVASLERGEALFHVRHDAGTPFTLSVGDSSIRDLGTVFDVTRRDARVDVAVSEGSVAFAGRGASVTLTRGQALAVDGAAGTALRHDVSPDEVGGWRTGALGFHEASLGDVVATVARLSGTDVAAAPGLPARPFTGMVRLTGTAGRDIPHLAELIGVGWHRQGERWVLGAPGTGATN